MAPTVAYPETEGETWSDRLADIESHVMADSATTWQTTLLRVSSSRTCTYRHNLRGAPKADEAQCATLANTRETQSSDVDSFRHSHARLKRLQVGESYSQCFVPRLESCSAVLDVAVPR